MSSFLIPGEKQRTRVAISITEGLTFIELDATLSEIYRGDATVTDHPVEEGADITDHIRRQPERVDIEAQVSNYPILALASLRAEPIQPGGDPRRRAEEAFEFLRGIKDAGLLVDLSTTLADYQNFAMVSLGVTRDKDTRNIVALSMSFREVQIALTETVDAPATAEPERRGRTAKGKKPKTTPPAPAAQKASALSSGINSLFGIP